MIIYYLLLLKSKIKYKLIFFRVSTASFLPFYFPSISLSHSFLVFLTPFLSSDSCFSPRFFMKTTIIVFFLSNKSLWTTFVSTASFLFPFPSYLSHSFLVFFSPFLSPSSSCFPSPYYFILLSININILHYFKLTISKPVI